MSGFWTLKIGKQKQDEQKSAKHNGSRKNGVNNHSDNDELPMKTDALTPVQTETAAESKIPQESETDTNETQVESENSPVTDVTEPKIRKDATNDNHDDSIDDVRFIDQNTLFSGYVELAINPPIETAALFKLYNNLQMTQGTKIMYVSGSLNRGTSITVSLEKPAPLLDNISNIKDLRITVLKSPRGGNQKPLLNIILGANKERVKRIDLRVKLK